MISIIKKIKEIYNEGLLMTFLTNFRRRRRAVGKGRKIVKLRVWAKVPEGGTVIFSDTRIP